MLGTDVERILTCLNDIKDELSTQIVALARVSDYRLTMIKHTHNVHVITSTGSSEGSADGAHGHGDGSHAHALDTYLQGDSPTDGVGHVNEISDQLTYPCGPDDGYPGDLHHSHPHMESGVIYEAEHPEPAAGFVSSILALGETFNEDADKMKEIDDDTFTDVTSFLNAYGSPWTEIYKVKEKLKEIEDYANDFPQLQWIGEKHALLSLFNMTLSYVVDAKHMMVEHADDVQRSYSNVFNGNVPDKTWDSFNSETIGQHSTNYSDNVHIETPNNNPY